MASETGRYTPVLDEYLKDFGLRQRDLMGKRILDAGAGMRMFAADCISMGVEDVWSIAKDDLDWLETKARMEQVERQNPQSEWLAIRRKVEEKSLVGLFQALPVASESFDLVLSRYGLTQALENEDQMVAAMLAMVRVLKHGGEVRFFPGWTEIWTKEQKYVVWGALSRIKDLPGIRIETKVVEIKIGGLQINGAMVILNKD